jgi:5-methylcytosine-specific restriction endonuclease McrA
LKLAPAGLAGIEKLKEVAKKKKPKKAKDKEINLDHWLTQKLRRISYQWPPRKEAQQAATTRRGYRECAICKQEFHYKETNMDHVKPVIDPHEGRRDWNTYIARLLPLKNGWQCLCIKCHDIKTSLENEIRKQVKTKSKQEDDL